MQTDTGSFTVQNVSGNTLARDFETAVRRSAMEGALFCYRWWNPLAQVADLTVLGTLTVDSIGTRTATLNCAQLSSGQNDTPGNVISAQEAKVQVRCTCMRRAVMPSGFSERSFVTA